MDWIETTFGIDPDGGSGLTEALILLAVFLLITIVCFRVRARRRNSGAGRR